MLYEIGEKVRIVGGQNAILVYAEPSSGQYLAYCNGSHSRIWIEEDSIEGIVEMREVVIKREARPA